MKINTKLSKSRVQASSNYKNKKKIRKMNKNPNNYFHKSSSFSQTSHLLLFAHQISSPLKFIKNKIKNKK